MIKFLTCFKCWGGKAVLTYEENRVYKISCECGCEYTFEHRSMKSAQEYHNKMLELYGEINKNAKLKADIRFKNEQISALKASNDGLCYSHDSLGAQITALKADNERLRAEVEYFVARHIPKTCYECSNNTGINVEDCENGKYSKEQAHCMNWQWRGIKETPRTGIIAE